MKLGDYAALIPPTMDPWKKKRPMKSPVWVKGSFGVAVVVVVAAAAAAAVVVVLAAVVVVGFRAK